MFDEQMFRKSFLLWSKIHVTVKKRISIIPPLAGMSITKLSLAGDNLILAGQGEFGSDILAGDGKIDNLFLQCCKDSRIR